MRVVDFTLGADRIENLIGVLEVTRADTRI